MESVDQLLKRIEKTGLKKAYVSKVLPDWVSEYPPKSATGLAEIKVHLARELGLDLPSLAESETVRFGGLPTSPKFKRAKNVDVTRLRPAASMFFSLARALATACRTPYRPLPKDPLQMRAEILESASSVTLQALLSYLWNHGVAVAHYSDWPDRLSRPSAMAVNVDGRPAVIVGSARVENAWHAYFVAHEAGHIAKAHLQVNEMIVDADDGSLDQAADDAQEVEADQFALAVLGGQEVKLPSAAANFSELDAGARAQSKAQRVDRGHLLLRYAMETGKWGMATTLLQQVEAGANAPVLINRDRAEEGLDMEQLSEDRQRFVRRALALG